MAGIVEKGVRAKIANNSRLMVPLRLMHTDSRCFSLTVLYTAAGLSQPTIFVGQATRSCATLLCKAHILISNLYFCVVIGG